MSLSSGGLVILHHSDLRVHMLCTAAVAAYRHCIYMCVWHGETAHHSCDHSNMRRLMLGGNLDVWPAHLLENEGSCICRCWVAAAAAASAKSMCRR